nr:hypothetical protein GCM10010200_029100 [Actinomadura rugatobispora]
MTLVYARIRPVYPPSELLEQQADTDSLYPLLFAHLLTCGVSAYSRVPLRGAFGGYGPQGRGRSPARHAAREVTRD